MLCEYGCGKESTCFIKGTKKWCCGKSPNGCDAIKEKKKQAYLLKYGVDNPRKSKEVKARVEQTNLDRYGSKHVVTSSIFAIKSKQTLMANFGVDNPSKSKEIQERKKTTSISRYGVDHWSKDEGVIEKKRQTYRERYGVDHYFQTDSFKDHCKRLFLERYGEDNPGKVEELRDKMIETCIRRYGLTRCKNVSNGETKWLAENQVTDTQVKIKGASGKSYFVDGIKDDVVYEFLGIFWHGHPEHFNYNDINPVTKTTYGELYENTKSRILDIENAGFKVIAIWESGTIFTGEETNDNKDN